MVKLEKLDNKQIINYNKIESRQAFKNINT